VAVARSMVARDPHTTQRLFEDLALGGLLPILRSAPTKRHAALRVLYAFAGPSAAARASAVRALHSHLNHLPTFLHCLSVLAFLEPSLDSRLLRLYTHYAALGSASGAPSVRAASVSIVAALAEADVSAAAGLLPALARLAEDPWWEVRAQLSVVVSALLSQTPPSSSTSSELALELLEQAMQPSQGSSVQRIAISNAGRALSAHPVLIPIVFDALRTLHPASAAKLLTPSSASSTASASSSASASVSPDAADPADLLPLVGASGTQFRVVPLPDRWEAGAVARALVEHVTGRGHVQQLDLVDLQVVLALLQTADAAAAARVVEELFPALEELLCVGVMRPELCVLTVHALRILLAAAPAAAVQLLASETFVGALAILLASPPADQPLADRLETLRIVADFLRDAARASPSANRVVQDALRACADADNDAFRRAPAFVELLEE
jgi:hypothetical protein